MASVIICLAKTGHALSLSLSKIQVYVPGLSQTLCKLSSFTNTPSGIMQLSQGPGLPCGNISNKITNAKANSTNQPHISMTSNSSMRKLQNNLTANTGNSYKLRPTSSLIYKEQLNFQKCRHYSTKKDIGQVTEDQQTLKHFGKKDSDSGYSMPHPIWSEAEVYDVKITHNPPETFADKLALWSVRGLRSGFDFFSGFNFGKRTEKKWLRRVIFLETVAGVPGMMGAMARHLRSLRRMQRDYGWIHTLLEEAENERMHLLTFLHVRQPGVLFRGTVLLGQGVFVNVFFLAYLIHPRFCHRFVGYLEEEAVKTYTKCLEEIDRGVLWKDTPAPEIAESYWQLKPGSSMRDVILAIRADEAHHRLVNHTFGSMSRDEFNPYKPGK